MKRLLITAMFFPTWLSIAEINHQSLETSSADKMVAQFRFEDAIVMMESCCDTFAIGKDMDLGLFQITPVLLQDYMDRTGEKYELGDMFNEHISRKIFRYYAKGKSFQQAARTWNGGPKGMKKQSTIQYWNKVKKLL